jgi:hypothetical protein
MPCPMPYIGVVLAETILQWADLDGGRLEPGSFRYPLDVLLGYL